MGTPSRNERLAALTLRGKNKISSNSRAARIPEGRCSKRYKGCTGDVLVSISNPDAPHLRIRLCANCFTVYLDKRPADETFRNARRDRIRQAK